MSKRIAGTLGAVAVAIAALACEDIAHVSDFKIDQAVASDGGPQAYHGVCNKCPASVASLRHPPCPVADPTPDDSHVYVYVWKTFQFGVSDDPKHTLDPSAYDTNVGYDLDCSDRKPRGLPVRCKPYSASASGQTPWEVYPEGIDNALTQRLLGPLLVQAAAAGIPPLDKGIDAKIASGGASAAYIIYNWNGTPNDPKVSFRVVTTLGTVDGKPPKWDGSDRWIAGEARPDPNLGQYEIPDDGFATDTAYVAGGVIVADLSFLNPAEAYVVNNNAILEVSMHHFVFSGQITKEELKYASVSARWGLDDILAAVPDLANYLAGCDAFIAGILVKKLPLLAKQAADMPLDDSASPDQPCSALSLSYGADAYRAHIGAYQSVTAASGCPH